MILTVGQRCLEIREDPAVFRLEFAPVLDPLAYLSVRAAAAVVVAAPPSDGRTRALEILESGDPADALRVASAVISARLTG